MTDPKSLFFEALDRSEEERSAYLQSACGKDAELFARVWELLTAHEKAGRFLSGDVRDSFSRITAADALAEGPGTVLGRYKLLEKIGEGGFGVVYMAEQREPVKRKVALKIIKLGMDTRQVVGRFEAERQALAMMDHPNIARVLDAGATDSALPTPSHLSPSPSHLAAGRPYFVMELVRGVPITQFCDENHFTMEERLRLFIRVCCAIQHAHHKGIIHRDIKPSNVLITMHDAEAVPKVIDFGIAKAIGQDLTDKTVFTRFHEFLGTPAYMSPEQTQLSGLDIDTRSDIYSLGVLLYELLTGHTAFEARELVDAGYDEFRRRIREEEPLKPSTRLNALSAEDRARIARHRRSDPALLRRMLKGDLDRIVMKALEKDRSRRYDSPAAFARDIERCLRDEPVSAVAPSVAYRFQKFARRHRAALATASALLAILVVATFVSAWLAFRATRAEHHARELLETEQHSRRQLEQMLSELKESRHKEEQLRQTADREAARARVEATNADAVARFINEDLFANADPDNEPEREITLRTVLDRASQQMSSSLTNQPLVAASIHRTIGRAYRNLGIHAPALEHLRRTSELYRAEAGETHPDSIRALSDFSDALDRNGRPAEAIVHARRANELAAQHLKEHPLQIKCAVRLSWVLWRNQKRQEAFELAEETYEAAQNLSAVDPRDMLSVMAMVAFHRGSKEVGDYAGGEAIFKQAIQLTQAHLGTNHLQTVRAKANLAVYYYNREMKLDEAEALHLEVLDSYRRALGESHERTVLTHANLGLLYEVTQKPAAALRHYRSVLEHSPEDPRALLVWPALSKKAPLPSLITPDSVGWRSFTNALPAGWSEPTFNDSTWSPGTTARTAEAWFRHEFNLDAVPEQPLVFTIGGWGEFEVFINGVPAVKKLGSAAGKFQLAVCQPRAMQALRRGKNVIGLHGVKLRPEENRIFSVRQ